MERVAMNVGMGGTSRYNAVGSTQTGTSLTQAQALPSVHLGPDRRAYTTGTSPDPSSSPTSSNSTAASAPSQHILEQQQQLLQFANARQLQLAYYHALQSPTHYLQPRKASPSRRGVSPHQRFADVQDGSSSNTTAGWAHSARGNDTRRRGSSAPRGGGHTNAAAGKREGSQPPRRPTNRRSFSQQSNFSSSLPSTPNHQPRSASGKDRSPSPHTSLLDSPRSASSEPLPASKIRPKIAMQCKYETLLSTVRRRFMYSIGCEYLPHETPEKQRLSEADVERLTTDMKVLFDQLLPTAESNERRRKLVIKLERLLNEVLPGHDFRVTPFGSSENKLCTTDSDVDVCIITQSPDGSSQTCAIAKALAENGMERVICVPTAKVPIVKIWDPELSVACDMNVNNTLALENTRMIKTYVEIDPRVQPLAMIVKHWTKQRQLNDALGATLGSYTWLCMILNYLQTREPPILPSLHERPHEKRPPIQGVDCSFDDNLDALRGFGEKNKESLGSLLFGFFRFYGYEVDYETSVMSVRLGKVITKEDKGWQYGHNNIICVEEPFNTWRNLSNTCDSYSAKGLHQEFRRGYKILAEKLDLQALCAAYEFPREEAPTYTPPPTQPKPIIARHASQPTRGRGGGHSGNGSRGGRSYSANNAKQNQHRKHPAQTQYANLPIQYPGLPDGYIIQPTPVQCYSPEALSLIPNIQAQIQVLQQAQANYMQLAQMHSQQNGAHNATQQPTPQEASPRIQGFAYYTPIFGTPYYYGQIAHPIETPNTPTSPPTTPSASDTRNNQGRGRSYGSYSPRSVSRQSRDQSSSSYGGSSLAHSNATVAPSEEDDIDYAEHSSTGTSSLDQFRPPPPETPPDVELPEQYVGYCIEGTVFEDLGSTPPRSVEEEPFVQQKYIVDRQKRLSQEKLPPPLLGKPGAPSAFQIAREQYLADMSVINRRSKGPYESRGPLIVNGSSSTQSSVYADSGFANSAIESYLEPSETFLCSQHFDATSGDLVPAVASNHVGLQIQPLLSVHPNTSSLSPPPEPTVTNTNRSGSQKTETKVKGVPRLQTCLQQYPTTDRLVGPGQNPSLESLKSRAEDISVPPTPASESSISQAGINTINGGVQEEPMNTARLNGAGEPKTSPQPAQPGPTKKQSKNGPTTNGQARRKGSKGQIPQTQPAQPVTTVDVVPVAQQKAGTKEPVKTSQWKKPKSRKSNKKQNRVGGAERKEVLVDGERKGG